MKNILQVEKVNKEKQQTKHTQEKSTSTKKAKVFEIMEKEKVDIFTWKK